VVFSSGFFGFFAHAGFLSALRELKISATGYSGASSGAIVAAMAAAGMSDQEIKDTFFGLKKSDFWDPDPGSTIMKKGLKIFKGYTGYLRGEQFARLLEKIPVKKIEDCNTPLVISATNLSLKREELFTRGSLIKAVQASGAVPALFKPVDVEGSLHVDGGVVNKAPVSALYDLVRPEKIIVHFIISKDIEHSENNFLIKRMTPWHIYQLSINISRQEAYKRQCDAARQLGVEIVEIKTDAPGVGPNNLKMGTVAYSRARKSTMNILSQM